MCPLVAGKGDGHGGSVGLSDGEGRGYGRDCLGLEGGSCQEEQGEVY